MIVGRAVLLRTAERPRGARLHHNRGNDSIPLMDPQTERETSRRQCLVVAALFFTLFFIFGSGYNTAGVFFTPVIKSFGWSRARMSTLQTALALAAGVSIPLIGWLLDRIEARVMMAAGAAM